MKGGRTPWLKRLDLGKRAVKSTVSPKSLDFFFHIRFPRLGQSSHCVACALSIWCYLGTPHFVSNALFTII